MGVAGLDNYSNNSFYFEMANKGKAAGANIEASTDKENVRVSDIIKRLEESHKLTAKELKDEKDWREMSDEEWDKLMENIDKYIDDYKARLEEMKKKQDEAARKAAMEAEPGKEALAAASAALAVAASGFTTGVVTSDEEADDNEAAEDGLDHEKNWTKRLETDDQAILMAAKEAQKMESNALSKFQEVQLTNSTTVGIASIDGAIETASVENDNEEKLWTITVFTEGGIISKKCQNGKIIDNWEIKYTKADDANKVWEFLNGFDKTVDLTFSGVKKFWEDFLQDKINIDDIFIKDGAAFYKESL